MTMSSGIQPILDEGCGNTSEDLSTSAVRPFIVGTIVGGVAGALVGTALSSHTRGFIVGLYQLVQRRLATSDYDRLRFELLLQ